jgi:hypothetical protein
MENSDSENGDNGEQRERSRWIGWPTRRKDGEAGRGSKREAGYEEPAKRDRMAFLWVSLCVLIGG